MKKSLIAVAVLGAIAGAAQAQSAVTIYGILDTGITYANKVPTPDNSSNDKKFSVDSGVIQGSRLGFKGVEDLGGGLKALFQLEAGLHNDTGALKKSVVGLSGNFGSILLGRQTDVLNDLTGAVDHNMDRLEGIRTNNSIRYTSTKNSIRYNTPNVAGFTGSLIYGFGEAAGQTSNGQSFSLGGQYANGPLGLRAAYYESKKGTTSSDTSNSNSKEFKVGNPGDTALRIFSLGSSYQAGLARLYGNWSLVKQPLASAWDGKTALWNNSGTPSYYSSGSINNSKSEIFELGVNYNLTDPLYLLGSVQYNRLTFVPGPKTSPLNNNGKLIQYNLGTDYFLSKRTDLYAFASLLEAKNAANLGVDGNGTGSAKSQTAVTVGIRHKF